MFFVERHYLRKHSTCQNSSHVRLFHGPSLTDASFSENFYGLKRRRRPYIETERAKAAVGGVQPGEKLRPQEIRQSLLFLVGIPYLRARAQDYYEELGGGITSEVLDEGMDARRFRAFTDAVRTRSFPSADAQLTCRMLELQGPTSAGLQDHLPLVKYIFRMVVACMQYSLSV
jgi:hypothetical protein